MTRPMMDNRMRLLTAHLGSLDTGHVLFGQAGTVQGLLGVLSVALQHLRLQLGADRPSVPGSAEDRQKAPMSSRWQRSYPKHFSFISEHGERLVKRCSPLVPGAQSGMHSGL